MIEYLHSLIAEREYGKALVCAEQLLSAGDNSPKDLLIINTSIVTCRLETKEYLGATVAGDLALKLAVELEEWDCYGVICLDLGVAHQMMGQIGQAIEYLFMYIYKLSIYDKSTKHEANVWYNLGECYLQLGDTGSASRYFKNALHAADRVQSERAAHGIRLALVGAFMKSDTLEPIPRLFAQCRKYIVNHPYEFRVRESLLWYFIRRAEHALVTNRFNKARAMALRGLGEAEGAQRWLSSFHMILADIANRQGHLSQALGHALSARTYALHAGRNDLEAQSVEFMYGITSRHPTAMEELEGEIQIGADPDLDWNP